MSYLDQRVSPARIWAIIVVAILHVLIGFAFITGFYQKFTKEGVQDLDVFDVEEPPPPEEEPPPPDEPVPEVQSPEVVVPPPMVPPRNPPPDQMRTVDRQDFSSMTDRADQKGEETPQRQTYTCPGTGQVVYDLAQCRPPEPRYKQCPGGQRVLETAACPEQPRPAPPTPARKTSGSISNDDYPAAAERAEAEGTTRITLSVGTNGRATGCSVTGSSGNGALDSTACRLAQQRFRFAPATRNGQPVEGSYSTSVVWRLQGD